MIDWDVQQVDGVDVEGSTTERQRDDGSVGAWNGVIALVVCLRSRDLGVDGLDVSVGGINEGGAGVKDGGAVLESEVLATYGHGERSFPVAVLVDVLEGNEGLRVEFGTVETSERNLAIVEPVGNSGKLVRRDGLADQPLLRKRLDRGRDTLFGNGRFG